MIQLQLFVDFVGKLFQPAEPSSRKNLVLEISSAETGDELLYGIWADLRHQWFSEREDLDAYLLRWSSRKQRRTLASCNIEKKLVTVARELNYDNLLHLLDPLLYHEMCHAVLGKSVYSKDKRSAWHGREFKALERRHPQIASFNRWLKSGGWERAVRSDRAKRAYRARVR